MKQYIKPLIKCIELRVEERLAGNSCRKVNGACGTPPDHIIYTQQI